MYRQGLADNSQNFIQKKASKSYYCLKQLKNNQNISNFEEPKLKTILFLQKTTTLVTPYPLFRMV